MPLVQVNFGGRHQLLITGVPVGRNIPEHLPRRSKDAGSIIIIIATDAPLLPHQLKRIARRATLGLARTGSIASNGSGDIFIAFSTANPDVAKPTFITPVQMLPNDQMNPLFEATIQATEEAIINALIAAETMIGYDGYQVTAIPHDRLCDVLKRYGRLVETNYR